MGAAGRSAQRWAVDLGVVLGEQCAQGFGASGSFGHPDDEVDGVGCGDHEQVSGLGGGVPEGVGRARGTNAIDPAGTRAVSLSTQNSISPLST